MLAYGVVVTLSDGSLSRTWRFMLVRPLRSNDYAHLLGLTRGCDWIAWPLVCTANADSHVYLDSRNIEVMA